MARTQNDDGFRRMLCNIFIHKMNLQEDMEAIMKLAKSPDDCRLLQNALMEIEQYVHKMREDLAQKQESNVLMTRLFVNPTKKEYNEGPLEGLETTATGVPPLNRAAPLRTAIQPSLDKSTYGHINGATAKHATDFKNFRKNPGVPDAHKIFLSRLNVHTTEEDLYKYFCGYDMIVDLRIFDLQQPRNWNVACVGFQHKETADRLIGQTLKIDGCETTARAYRSKEKSEPEQKIGNQRTNGGGRRAKHGIRQSQYQIFVGGIPVTAHIEEVKRVIATELYYGIRDVRMIHVEEKQRIRHRGFAYVDLESDDDANHLLEVRFLTIQGKQVECKANTRTKAKILADPNTVPPEYLDQLETESEVNSPRSSNNDSGYVDAIHPSDSATDNLCILCGRPRGCSFLPCKHSVTCIDCGSRVKNCPQIGCGQPIEGRGICT